jgi:DNA repair exonuclease SbcCD ATPase subunit
MQPKDSETFRFGKDDEDNNEIMHLELQELKMEKLSHRLTLLTILIPCVIGIILGIAYLDIKDRVTRTYDTGTVGVRKLSKDMESKFSSLSLEQAKIKDTLSKLPDIENNTAFAQSRIKPMEKTLKRLDTTSINRDELSRVVERMNERFSSIPSNLKTELQSVKTENQEAAKALAEISERLDRISQTLLKLGEAVNKLSQNMASLEEQSVTKSELELALKLKEIAAKQTLLETRAAFEERIKRIETDLRRLEKKAADLQNSDQTHSTLDSTPATPPAQEADKKQAPAAGSASPPDKPSAASSSPSAVPATPEQIMEQNIE